MLMDIFKLSYPFFLCKYKITVLTRNSAVITYYILRIYFSGHKTSKLLIVLVWLSNLALEYV